MRKPKLTADMTDDEARPYFLWDEDITIGDLKEILNGPDGELRDRYLGKMLREARDIDVWHFVTPADVATALPRISRIVGQKLPFWEFIIGRWIKDGLLVV